jgi:hypothetical protein
MSRRICVAAKPLFVLGIVFASTTFNCAAATSFAAQASAAPEVFQVQGAANYCGGVEYTVPSDHQAVIETVSGEAQTSSGNNVYWVLTTTVGDVPAYQVFVPIQTVFGTFVLSTQTRRYADPGTIVSLVPSFTVGASLVSCNFISFSGHLRQKIP